MFHQLTQAMYIFLPHISMSLLHCTSLTVQIVWLLQHLFSDVIYSSMQILWSGMWQKLIRFSVLSAAMGHHVLPAEGDKGLKPATLDSVALCYCFMSELIRKELEFQRSVVDVHPVHFRPSNLTRFCHPCECALAVWETWFTHTVA